MSSKLWRAMREIIHLRKRACTQCDGNKSLLSISVGNYTAEYKYTYIYIYIYAEYIGGSKSSFYLPRRYRSANRAQRDDGVAFFYTEKHDGRACSQRNATLCYARGILSCPCVYVRFLYGYRERQKEKAPYSRLENTEIYYSDIQSATKGN